jgi:hypothetical protein
MTKYQAKHREKDVVANCKNHGISTKQNINGGKIYCLICNREVK